MFYGEKNFLHYAIFTFFIFTTSMVFARDYVIFSISQGIPMGVQNEIRSKNYYVNLGKQQGVERGTRLQVFRTISRVDPFQDNQRQRFDVKIGELKVLHTEDNRSIALISPESSKDQELYTEIDSIMIGDYVEVKVD